MKAAYHALCSPHTKPDPSELSLMFPNRSVENVKARYEAVHTSDRTKFNGALHFQRLRHAQLIPYCTLESQPWAHIRTLVALTANTERSAIDWYAVATHFPGSDAISARFAWLRESTRRKVAGEAAYSAAEIARGPDRGGARAGAPAVIF